MNDTLTPLALYIHWPFCVSKCPYCDFNSHVRDQVDMAVWQNALLADLAFEAARDNTRPLGSIFFGGGTPSLMPPALVERLMDAARDCFGFEDGIEITLEANPSSVEAANFADLGRAGINRVSLGLQSLDDDALRFLGRAHSVAEALAALETAQRHFDRVSIDLIYARPDQSAAQWETELKRAIGFGTTHMSLYQLTIEPGTRFETLVRTGKIVPMDEDPAAALFEMTRTITHDAGLPAYEISNHSRPGDESVHNLTYWRYRDYAGIGPGAHGRRNGYATQRHKKPENFLSAVTRNGNGHSEHISLSRPERATEALLMGLRLYEGIDLSDISERTGLAPDQLVDGREVARLEELGMVARNGTRLCVTPRGMLLLDAILPRIVAIEPAATGC